MKKLFFFLFFSFNSFALSPEQHLSNQAQEERAMKLFSEVKCLVCNGQAIESSNTEFSFEMRKLIREKIAQGASDKQIKQELVAEFGEEILFSSQSRILWILPAVVAILGLVGLLYSRRSR